jgi:hypothetical protein
MAKILTPIVKGQGPAVWIEGRSIARTGENIHSADALSRFTGKAGPSVLTRAKGHAAGNVAGAGENDVHTDAANVDDEQRVVSELLTPALRHGAYVAGTALRGNHGIVRGCKRKRLREVGRPDAHHHCVGDRAFRRDVRFAVRDRRPGFWTSRGGRFALSGK